MFIIKLVEYLKGYVIIQVDGSFLERFINVCMRRSLFIWQIKMLGSTRMSAKISISSFKKIRSVAFKTKSKIKITKKRGMPFIIKKHKKRQTALLGLALFFMILWYCATYVTGIEISGNVKVSNDIILTNLAQCGAKMGKKMKSVDTDFVQNYMMSKISQLSWIGINKHGSKLYVEVKERSQAPAKVDKYTPCNIVANKNGVIVSVSVEYGESAVKVGDAVLKGDLLVSGVLDSEVLGLRYLHSSAEIMATTWYEKSASLPLEYQQRQNTGNKVSKYLLSVAGIDIKFFINDRIPYTFYDKVKESRPLRLPFDILPTISWKTEYYLEQTSQTKRRTIEEAVDMLATQLKSEIEMDIPSDAEKKEFSFSYALSADQTEVEAHGIYYAVEDIANEVIINIEN